jgi:hypothetical protein
MEGMTTDVGREGLTVSSVTTTGAGFGKTPMGATGKGTGTGGAHAKTGVSVCSPTTGGGAATEAGFGKTAMGATGEETGIGGALAETGGSVCSSATGGGEHDLLEAERESA